MDAISDTISALKKLKKLKIFTSVDAEWFGLLCGRSSLILGAALELCSAREASQKGDVIDALAHGAVAGGSAACLLASLAVGSGAAAFALIVGGALLASGGVTLAVTSGLLQTDVGAAFGVLFPNPVPPDSFEAQCLLPFGLKAEIEAAKQTFNDAGTAFFFPGKAPTGSDAIRF